ncbi:hypothetical protein FHX44_111026 [Pseudonocardia hierapolitana]|uniref:Flavodoxin-like protein n=1 Tax=Pseudonocardia hierapolitana TaxID=1128676 RepID=A0A561SK01_9PSEU|nr:hypothetical protein [Pseudonocardia hierapolitana]TWF75142.1 hypothetical protein FHX44_111026 [Pseudonocardia hierapolitana]
MRALVVVESVFGNTRRIAEEVAHGLAEGPLREGELARTRNCGADVARAATAVTDAV